MYTEAELDVLRKKLLSIRNMETLPSEGTVFDMVERTIKTLGEESKSYRPHGKDKNPGGLLEKSMHPVDLVFALLSVFATMYIFFEYDELVLRAGMNTETEL